MSGTPKRGSESVCKSHLSGLRTHYNDYGDGQETGTTQEPTKNCILQYLTLKELR